MSFFKEHHPTTTFTFFSYLFQDQLKMSGNHLSDYKAACSDTKFMINSELFFSMIQTNTQRSLVRKDKEMAFINVFFFVLIQRPNCKE